MFLVVLISINVYAWAPPPPTTFIPEYGRGFVAVKGSYVKVEEDPGTGNRSDIEAYSGGLYFFHGFDQDLAYGIGSEYMKGNGDQMIVDPVTNAVTIVSTDIEIIAPAGFIVYTLMGGAMRNGMALTFGYSKMFFKIKDYERYSKNVFRFGWIGQYFLLRPLALVPYIEWALNGQSGADLVLHLRGFQISIGAALSLFGKDDEEDKGVNYSFCLRKTW